MPDSNEFFLEQEKPTIIKGNVSENLQTFHSIFIPS
jgi:hypothetical protein